jgi:hypothetical protein
MKEENMTEPVSEDDVRSLAATADLPLSEDRLGAVAELLGSWLPAANELSRKMSAPAYLETMPITVLVHPNPPLNGE